MVVLYQYTLITACYTKYMAHKITNKSFLLLLAFGILLLSLNSLAESRRINVYQAGQNLWHTKSGETLSGIAKQLLPNNPGMQQLLMLDIVALNPNAFLNNNPNKMKADIRLLLPGEFTKADNRVDPSKIQVETFSWGNIKRIRR